MIIEHRRHSIRTKPNSHLNLEGIKLANQVGASMGEFDHVFTSESIRAVETAVAMGYPIDETIDFSTTIGGKASKHEEIPEGSPFTDYSEAINTREGSKVWGNNVKSLILSYLDKLDTNSKVLIVSHAGIIEISTASFFEDQDLSYLGNGVERCEGVRIYYENGKFTKCEILRL